MDSTNTCRNKNCKDFFFFCLVKDYCLYNKSVLTNSGLALGWNYWLFVLLINPQIIFSINWLIALFIKCQNVGNVPILISQNAGLHTKSACFPTNHPKPKDIRFIAVNDKEEEHLRSWNISLDEWLKQLMHYQNSCQWLPQIISVIVGSQQEFWVPLIAQYAIPLPIKKNFIVFRISSLYVYWNQRMQ